MESTRSTRLNGYRPNRARSRSGRLLSGYEVYTPASPRNFDSTKHGASGVFDDNDVKVVPDLIEALAAKTIALSGVP